MENLRSVVMMRKLSLILGITITSMFLLSGCGMLTSIDKSSATYRQGQEDIANDVDNGDPATKETCDFLEALVKGLDELNDSELKNYKAGCLDWIQENGR